MDNAKIGKLILRLRKENHMTQLQLAQQLHVSDKAVSKWERGLGCPDVSLLSDLSRIFRVNLEELLSGKLNTNDSLGGNMRRTQFYVCPDCGNIITAMTDSTVSCCGKKLTALQPQKAVGADRLSVERIEYDYFISSDHPMEKGHYISFIALLTGDSMMVRKQYPEWCLQVRIPAFAHGRLLWYCSNHGLFYQDI